ncbi:hypothetical protein [Cryptosporangium sp. NPDC051539]|uniref:hypothetical protein n=1 Tax=Cryptosporangium sp. NPDC051539 TaxID=3363962 RepID=UPI0037955479
MEAAPGADRPDQPHRTPDRAGVLRRRHGGAGRAVRRARFVTGGRAAEAAYEAFAYDGGFLRVRAPFVLAVLVFGLAVQAALVWAGRWRPALLLVDLVHVLVVCTVLTWAIGAGPIFVATRTDQAVKGVIAVIIVLTLVDLAVRARRLSVASAIRH